MLSKLNITNVDAYHLYLFIKGIQEFAFEIAFTVIIVYQVTVVGLNVFELVLVGTVLEITVFLLEIPTGVIADVFSRRLSVILGYLLLGIGIIIEGIFPIFAIIIVANMVDGVGHTLLSGATSAWLVDEIGQERASNAFLRGSQVTQVTSVLGIIVSVMLASINIQLAIVTGGVLLVLLSFVLMLIMPENGFQRVPKSERESWSDLFSTFRAGAKLVRGRRVLLTILLIALIYGAFTEGFDRLWTAHILTNFTLPSLGQFDEIVWFGIINAVFMPITLLATEIVRRRVDLTSNHAITRVLRYVYAGMILSVLLFTLGEHFGLVLMGLWITGTLRTVAYPLMESWINQHTDSNVRATVLSIWGQTDALGQIAGGPVVGAIGVLTGVRVAITISALMITPLIIVFNRTLKSES